MLLITYHRDSSFGIPISISFLSDFRLLNRIFPAETHGGANLLRGVLLLIRRGDFVVAPPHLHIHPAYSFRGVDLLPGKADRITLRAIVFNLGGSTAAMHLSYIVK